MPTPKRKHHGRSSLKNGWNQIARDLDCAIASAGLGIHESFILNAVRVGCWAIPAIRSGKAEEQAEAVPCLLNLTALAELSCRPRQLLSRALGSLVAAGILRKDDDGAVSINKDYSTWIYPATESGSATPRFTLEEIAFIDGAARIGSDPESCNPWVSHPRKSRNPRGAIAATWRLRKPKPEGRDRRNLEVADQPAAIEERARQRDLEPLETWNHPQPPEGAPAAGVKVGDRGFPEGVLSPAEEAARPRTVGGLPIPGSGSPQAAAVRARLAPIHGDEIADVAGLWCDYYPPEWIEATVRRKLVGREGRGASANIGYLGAILDRQLQDGRCEFLAVAGGPSSIPMRTGGQAILATPEPTPEERRRIFEEHARLYPRRKRESRVS